MVPFHGIPGETARIARSIFHSGNSYLMLGDHIGQVLEGLPVDTLRPAPDTSLERTAILALITTFQFKEQLNDAQAAEAVRLRPDWKYALHLSPYHPGLDPSWMCGFRRHLHYDDEGKKVFQVLLDRLSFYGFFEKDPSPAAARALTSLCFLNRIERVVEAMKNALGTLAGQDPDRFRVVILPHWYLRYLPGSPGVAARMSGEPAFLPEEVGSDILYLLHKCDEMKPSEWNELPEIKQLRKVLSEQYEPMQVNTEQGVSIRWRQVSCIYPQD